MKYTLLTFGCRVNQAESLAIERDLRARGGRPVPADEADLVIVNSCSVTATADQGTRQSIRRLARDNPSARIVVTGCYATRCPEEVANLPGVVQVVSNAQKDDLVDHLGARFQVPGAETAAASPGISSGVESGTWNPAPHALPAAPGTRHLAPQASPSLPMLPVGALGRTAFTLRVQNGCEEGCSYCIIPSTRGASRSTPLEPIVAELQRIEAAGFREVTLTGVHLGAWGRDGVPASSLEALVAGAIDGTRDLVVRLGSLEPMDCTPGLIDLAVATSRLAPYFHLPLQHASDRLLQAMRRPYTLASYAALVDSIRARLPHAAIGTDLIAGFPGEAPADAECLLAYVAGSPLTNLHVFPYSDRPGTAASLLQPKVHGAIVRNRARALREAGHRLNERFRRSQAGTTRPALTIENGSEAVTDNGFRVRIAPALPRNMRTRVRLAWHGEDLVGEVSPDECTATPA